jgi:hypothetical protein
VTKSFRIKAEAEKFQFIIESEMSRAVYIDRGEPERTALRDPPEQYLREVVPTKTGHQEAYRVKALMDEPLALVSLTEVGSQHFASYLNAELRRVSQDSPSQARRTQPPLVWPAAARILPAISLYAKIKQNSRLPIPEILYTSYMQSRLFACSAGV